MNRFHNHSGPRIVAVVVALAIATFGAALAVNGLAGADAADERQTGDPSDTRYFGAIPAAYVGPPELVFDEMELLVGAEARRAARVDGIPEDEVGDFYIRDRSGPTVSLPVADDVVVTVVRCGDDGCSEGHPVDYGDFTTSLSGTDDSAAVGSGRYWLTVRDGLVVQIDEQYVP